MRAYSDECEALHAWRRGEHRIGELRTAAARGGALASPPHRHLFPLIASSSRGGESESAVTVFPTNYPRP